MLTTCRLFIIAPLIVEVVTEVCDSFEKIKRIPTWEELLSYQLFENMFELAPEQWDLFPFTKKDFETKDAKFMAFAKRFARMLDLAVQLLGPDMEVVEEQLGEIGLVHDRYGVKEGHYILMGKALDQTLHKILGRRSYTDKTKHAWTFIFKFMSDTMVEAAKKA